MKITVLAENTSKSDDFLYEHGLSLYIETNKHRILFDCGQSDVFIKNADKMNIDLSKVDTFVLSHGHYDHGGGLSDFIKLNNKAKIYINENAFNSFYNGDGKYIGLDNALKNNSRVIFTKDELKIDEQLYLFTENRNIREFYMDNYALTVEKDNIRIADDFFHEQYLIITENNNKTLFSGCSHKGIFNIMKWAEKEDIKNFVGGFHFMKENNEDTLFFFAEKLKEYNCNYYTCHCTGINQYNLLREKMGEQIEYICTGVSLNI